MGADARLRLSLLAEETYTGETRKVHARSRDLQMPEGRGAGQVDAVWSGTRTVDGTWEDVDLCGGLLDARERPVRFEHVRAVWIRPTQEGSYLWVGNTQANGFTGPLGAVTHRQKAEPDAPLVWIHGGEGWATRGGGILRIDPWNQADPVPYEMTVWGVKALAVDRAEPLPWGTTPFFIHVQIAAIEWSSDWEVVTGSRVAV